MHWVIWFICGWYLFECALFLTTSSFIYALRNFPMIKSLLRIQGSLSYTFFFNIFDSLIMLETKMWRTFLKYFPPSFLLKIKQAIFATVTITVLCKWPLLWLHIFACKMSGNALVIVCWQVQYNCHYLIFFNNSLFTKPSLHFDWFTKLINSCISK